MSEFSQGIGPTPEKGIRNPIFDRGSKRIRVRLQVAGLLVTAAGTALAVQQAHPQQQEEANQEERQTHGCSALPSRSEVTGPLTDIVVPGDRSANGGLGNPMWAVLVDRNGTICAVTRSGESFREQWLGSRAIAASKAYTANAFSLPGFALSTANLYWPTQPGNSLYGTAFANPINALALYGGEVASWGSPDDPLTGRRIGGTTAFGGGLALYSADGEFLGALGVSGDESCTDHVVAWKLRHRLNLDNVPDGVAPGGSDNIIYDLTVEPGTGRLKSASGYGHPTCSGTAEAIAESFSRTAPIGPQE